MQIGASVKQYVHHIPGRLRVKSPRLKSNAREGAAIKSSLLALDGVGSAETNTVTGSVTVSYDPERCDVGRIMTYLQATGHLRQPVNLTIAESSYRPATSIDPVAKMIMTAVLKKLIERSATAMVAAII
jgi:hypothetical protein